MQHPPKDRYVDYERNTYASNAVKEHSSPYSKTSTTTDLLPRGQRGCCTHSTPRASASGPPLHVAEAVSRPPSLPFSFVVQRLAALRTGLSSILWRLLAEVTQACSVLARTAGCEVKLGYSCIAIASSTLGVDTSISSPSAMPRCPCCCYEGAAWVRPQSWGPKQYSDQCLSSLAWLFTDLRAVIPQTCSQRCTHHKRSVPTSLCPSKGTWSCSSTKCVQRNFVCGTSCHSPVAASCAPLADVEVISPRCSSAHSPKWRRVPPRGDR